MDDYKNQTWPLCYNDISFCKLWMKSMHPFKSYWEETISLPCILLQQQKLSRKRAITLPKFCRWLLISNLTCILQWYILLQTFNKNQCIPAKIYWSETNINTPTKIKSKKGHNSAKIWWMITNIELDLYFTVIKSSAKFEWNQCIPSKVIEQKRTTKLSWKRAITQPKLGRWLPISNLTCIL